VERTIDRDTFPSASIGGSAATTSITEEGGDPSGVGEGGSGVRVAREG
jgi:hypothetical protein